QFGAETETICRRYLEFRYQLLPYLYNLFHQAAQTGAPIMRPLVWHYPKDPATFNLNDQFMLGPDLLVAPMLFPGLSARTVYLPKGTWYRWRVGESSPDIESFEGPAHVTADAPLEELPLFVRGGALIPMWPLAQHTGAINRAGLRLHVWPGKGQLDFYEDDGRTRAFERGPEGWRLVQHAVPGQCNQCTGYIAVGRSAGTVCRRAHRLDVRLSRPARARGDAGWSAIGAPSRTRDAGRAGQG
ncbi:MAG: hypothetical protein M1546_22940, partial [Chloroflexi bacterium]|nr:hypothetical protein [Chloroflexota bacterium]